MVNIQSLKRPRWNTGKCAVNPNLCYVRIRSGKFSDMSDEGSTSMAGALPLGETIVGEAAQRTKV
jgi:hypothetical protein